jgi:hypothetical protein
MDMNDISTQEFFTARLLDWYRLWQETPRWRLLRRAYLRHQVTACLDLLADPPPITIGPEG